MSTQDDAFEAEAKSLNYTFRAKAGTKPTWTPRWGFVTDEPGFDPRFKIGGQFGGWFYGVRAYGGHGGGNAEATRGPPVNSYSDFAGVLGTGVYVTGVAGTSINNSGVYGQTGEDPDQSIPAALSAGVFGASNTLPGVRGWSTQNHGVIGESYDGWGVSGRSYESVGVFGISVTGMDSGVIGISSMLPMPGPMQLARLPAAGVVGSSNPRPGVIGVSNTDVGVLGVSNAVGISGQGSVAGYFQGDVIVDGNFTVIGFPGQHTKSVAVPFPDGTQRLMYCMESPELWFEDFGTAKLKNGRAVVKLDADFGRVIKRGDYRVFFTPEGDCRGLYLRRKRTGSFEVRELMDGKSSVAFSYRIVGRRKDIRRHRRFAKIDTRLPVSAPAPARRKPKAASRSSTLRAFVASLEKEARAGSVDGGRSGALPSSLRPHCTCGLRGGGKRPADEHQTLTFYEQAPQASVNAPTRSRRIIAGYPSAAACVPPRAIRSRSRRASRRRYNRHARVRACTCAAARDPRACLAGSPPARYGRARSAA
jgi:hypothetical protein